MKSKNKKSQIGAETLEFMVIALFLFTLLFAVFHWSFVFYKVNALNEAARRGARMAVICPFALPQVRNIAVYNSYGNSGVSPVVGGLMPANVQVRYLDIAGAPVTAPTTVTTLASIAFIEVELTGIQSLFNFPAIFGGNMTPPVFRTTLPRESLGVVPSYPGEPINTDSCNF